MKLRPFANLLNKNTVILKDGISLGDFFTDSYFSRDEHYYYVSIAGSDFTHEDHDNPRPCVISVLSREDDEPPETDIIFNVEGRFVHLDFSNVLANNQFVQLVFSRNPEDNPYYPFIVEFLYV